MSDPKEQQPKDEELDLKSETVADLDPRDKEADEVRGGGCGNLVSLCVLSVQNR